MDVVKLSHLILFGPQSNSVINLLVHLATGNVHSIGGSLHDGVKVYHVDHSIVIVIIIGIIRSFGKWELCSSLWHQCVDH